MDELTRIFESLLVGDIDVTVYNWEAGLILETGKIYDTFVDLQVGGKTEVTCRGVADVGSIEAHLFPMRLRRGYKIRVINRGQPVRVEKGDRLAVLQYVDY